MEIKAGRALHLGGIPALGYDIVEVNEEKNMSTILKNQNPFKLF